MDIPTIIDLDRKVLTYTLSGLLICSICFTLGRCTSPTPSKNEICVKEIEQIATCGENIKRTEAREALLKSQLAICEDSCGEALGKLARRKNVECDKLRASDVARLKKLFQDYKCKGS